MCENCLGTGRTYDYDNVSTHIIPCPNEQCRAEARRQSRKHIDRIKQYFGMGVSA